MVMEPEWPLTEEELARRRHELSLLSESSVQQVYREAHERCLLVDDRLPRPRAIQELVQAWKQLWTWRRR
jgi:hypothetical protein